MGRICLAGLQEINDKIAKHSRFLTPDAVGNIEQNQVKVVQLDRFLVPGTLQGLLSQPSLRMSTAKIVLSGSSSESKARGPFFRDKRFKAFSKSLAIFRNFFRTTTLAKRW